MSNSSAILKKTLGIVIMITLVFSVKALSQNLNPFPLINQIQIESLYNLNKNRSDSEYINEGRSKEDIDGFGDEEGFDNESDFSDSDIDLADVEIIQETGGSINGFFREEMVYAYAKNAPYWTKIRSVLNLNLEYKFSADWQVKAGWNGFYDYAYELKGKDEFSDETLDAYESESEIREMFVNGVITDGVNIKFGRQIIAWGESDGVQIIDLANPRDQREFGQIDLEDSRIPVTASKFSFLKNNWTIDLVSIHEIRTNRNGEKGSDFDPFKALRKSDVIILKEEVPKNKIENTEYLTRFTANMSGGDFSLIWADVFDDSSYLDSTVYFVDAEPVVKMTPKHKRIKVVGFSGNIVSGSFVWKTEGSKTFHKAVQRNDLNTQMAQKIQNASYEIKSWSEKDTLILMLGTDYSGVTDLTISLEAIHEEIIDYEEHLAPKNTTDSASIRLSYDTLNSTLSLNALLATLGKNYGNLYRFDVAYDIVDAFEVNGGLIFYEANDKDQFLYEYRKEDRAFMTLKYSF